MDSCKEQWLVPRASPILGIGDVHIWRAPLDVSLAFIDTLKQTLSEDETLRAQRFCFSKDREHYVAARGILRRLLGQYLRQPPAQLCFQYNAHGKPMLRPSLDGRNLQFNLSHSHGIALYAFAWERALGVDIEHVRGDLAYDAIAERFFAPQESASLLQLAEELRLEAFFTCWTRKEAYIKARGDGLACPLDHFVVSVLPGEPARLVSHAGDPGEERRWLLMHLDPGQGAVGALVTTSGVCRATQWQWQENPV